MKNIELTVVIPTFNEGDIIESSLKIISEALEEIRPYTEIIIADDGTDNLPEVIARCGGSFGCADVRVMRNSKPLGKGQSIKRAFDVSEGQIVGFIDVDLSVSPSYIHECLREIRAGNHMSIASRVGNRWKSDKSVMTSLLGSIFSFIHRTLLFGRKRSFRDTQCGFKFFERRVAIELYDGLVATDGLNDLEILLKAVNSGYRISEIEVPRINDRVGKIRISTILTRETVSLWRIFRKYRLGW